MNYEIALLQTEAEAMECATIMTSSDPWITLQRSYEQCLTGIQDAFNEVHLFKVEKKIAGFGIINLKGSLVGYIRTVAFKEEFRGQGLGKHFIGYLEEIIFKLYPNVFLCVSSFNPGARKLYEALGYEYVGELKDYFVTGYSEILLRKTRGPISSFQPRL